MAVELKFHNGLQKTDPKNHPVLIIGQLKHLNQLQFSQISCKLEPRVTEDIFKAALAIINANPTESCPMFMNSATIAALPTDCSRHNSPSRAVAITKIVNTSKSNVEETVIIVCEKPELYASACAVAKAFPSYSKKTSGRSHSSVPSQSDTANIEFIIMSSGDAVEPLTPADLELLNYTAAGIRLTQSIIDRPCNEMNVDDFITEAKKVAAELKITPVIIRGEELRERGFGGLYGVGKAATVPPALVILTHSPPGARNSIAWVGKGIVYDTGGLSLKAPTTMVGMKIDCAGAAGILGAFYAAVKSHFTETLSAVLCLAENSVGPNATRPDDIHTLYSGLTVEINNTDAEGRLVLADGVAYAKKDLKANIILDMATLTNAQAVTTGQYHGAVMSNLENWETRAVEAGKNSGDLLFPILYCPELHFSEFNSKIADMKNSVANRSNAQSSCAGLFVNSHLGFEYPGAWIHVDMLGPGVADERGTGYGVALLTTLFGNYTKQPLLNAVCPYAEETTNMPKKQRV